MARESHPGVLSHRRPQSRQTDREKEGGEESSMKNEASDGQKTMMKRQFLSKEVVLDPTGHPAGVNPCWITTKI